MARRFTRGTDRDHPALFRRRCRASMLASISDPAQRERFERDFPEENLPALPKKRAKRVHDPKAPLERNVLPKVVRALRKDPRVVRVQRNTVGRFTVHGRIISVGTKGLLDLTVYLRDGRYAEIEVKRPGEKPKLHQAQRIADIQERGGIAGWCDSPEGALAILP